MNEFELIEHLFRRRARRRADVVLGIGDDGAVIEVPPDHQLVTSTDTLVTGVHFPTSMAAFDVGYRALASNLSDLAAMAAQPRWALVALTIPAIDVQWLTGFADGLHALADRFDVAIIGGDTTAGPMSITLTVSGVCPRGVFVTRAGARADDLVFVTGTVGDAQLGLAIGSGATDADSTFLYTRFARPEPRVAAGIALRGLAHSMIDVSDGVLADLGHILEESGVGAQIDLDALPLSPAALRHAGRHRALQGAATGGDDYELLFTAAPSNARRTGEVLAEHGCAATAIGRITAVPGLALTGPETVIAALGAHGYRHF